jgi:hypothetical protein
MSMAIQGGISPESIIAFIQQHTEDCALQVKGEMQAAQDRTGLVKDVADFAAKMEDCKTRGDWGGLDKAIADFAETHKEAWGGGSHDMVLWMLQTRGWERRETLNPDTYGQVNNADATSFETSYSVTGKYNDNWDNNVENDAKTMVASWIQELNNWKDQVSGDDKIGMMKLQEDADRLKNLYELGSNLISKVDGCASSIIGNIGRA